MHLLRLRDLARPVHKRARQATLAARALAVRNQQRVLRELGAPRNDRREQRRVQRLLRGRGRLLRRERELQPRAELRGVEQRQPRVADLEEDFDEVEGESFVRADG